MTTYTIPSADFIATYNDAGTAAGDTIIVTDSNLIDLGTTFTFNKGVTIKSSLSVIMDADPLGSGLGASAPTHPARFTRNLRFQCLAFVTIPLVERLRIEHASFTFDEALWPDWVGAGTTWENTGLGNRFVVQGTGPNAGITQLVGCEIYAGYGPSKLSYIDALALHSGKLPDVYSPTTYFGDIDTGLFSRTQDATYDTPFPAGHGDDVGVLPNEDGSGIMYSAILKSPSAIGGAWSGLEVTDLYVHDIQRGFHLTVYDGANVFKCNGGWFEDIYTDRITVTGNARYLETIQINGNIGTGKPIASGNDLGNPHADNIQVSDQSAADALIRRISANNNMFFSPEGSVYILPGIFMEDTFQFIGTELRNNIAIGVGKFNVLNRHMDAYIRNSLALNPPWLGDDNFLANIAAYVLEPTTAFRSSGLYKDNIVEQIFGVDNDVLTGNVTPPDRDAAGQATYYTGDMATAPTTLWEAYETYKRQPAYDDKGPQFATLDAFLAGWTDFTGEPIWAQVPPDLGTATKNVVWVSHPVVVHGGNIGDTLTIDGLDPALEWRELDLDNLAPDLATEVQTWSAAPGTITIGNRLQLRTTTPDSNSAVLALPYSVGGTAFTWRIITQSANIWPVATIPDTTRLAKATNGLTGLVNDTNGGLSLAFRFAPLSLAANKRILALSNGAHMSLGAVFDNKARLHWNIVNSAGQSVTSQTIAHDIAEIQAGVMCEFAVSFDLAQSTATAGVIVYRTDGTQVSSFTGVTWNDYIPRFEDVKWALFGDSTGNFNPSDLAYFALWGQTIDWTDSLTRSKLGVDFIGPAGEGPTGGTAALIFVPGVAADIDTDAGNRGTGGVFAKGGTSPGTITQSVAATWPPPLTLYTTVLTANPTQGEPVEILVQAAGTPKEVVLTPTPSGVAGALDEATTTMPLASNGVIVTFTPSAAGTLTIAWANEGGYTNPDDTVIEVAAVARTFRPGCLSLGFRLGF